MKQLLAALLLLAASLVVAPAARADDGLRWMAGCWRASDRSYKEVWSRPESGLLFGYALSYDEAGALDFFEQARIEGGPLAIFNAYPGGAGPTAFIEENRGENSVTFVNAAHDYPQRIMYTRRGGRMAATISRMDGTQAHTWTLRKC